MEEERSIANRLGRSRLWLCLTEMIFQIDLDSDDPATQRMLEHQKHKDVEPCTSKDNAETR